jgi:hypothetical protein
MRQLPIPINKQKIDACCKKHHITYLALAFQLIDSLSAYRESLLPRFLQSLAALLLDSPAAIRLVPFQN